MTATDGHKPLRILHLTAGSDAGGISRYLHELSTSLIEAGHDVTITGERGAWHALFERSQVRWLELPLKAGPLDLWRASRSLLRVLERQRVDILHAHYRKATLVARRLARSLDIPVLFTLHLTGIPMGWPWNWLTDFGDHTHTPGIEGRRWLEEAGVPTDRISVIPHGVDPQKFPQATAVDQASARAELGLDPDATIAAFVGRFDDPKNEGWILDAARAVRDAMPGQKLQFVMLGGGPHQAQLVQRVADEGLSTLVKLLTYGDPLPVYRAADAVLLPSALEGFSLVTTEAMSVGRPVLRTRTAGAEQIVENVTGRSVAIEHDAFVRAAMDFVRDRDALRRMGEAAARHVREHLTLDRQVARTVELYRRLIESRR